MKNTGICRRVLISSAVLMAMAVSTFGSVRASDDLPAPDLFAAAVTVDSKNPVELFRPGPGSKIIDARKYRVYTQGYTETSYQLTLAGADCKSPAGLVIKTGSGNVVLS